MKFDSNAAWKLATTAISANREVVIALAGVFFLLPGLAMSLLLPAPQPTAGMDEQAVMAMVSGYYGSILPVAIPLVLFQAAGTLAVLTLLTDRRRPTVGDAIREGARAILPYFLSQLALALGAGLVGGLLIGVTAAAGLPAIGIALALIGLVYAFIKSSLAAPVIVVEHERNPIAALRRSWFLTRGNSARITAFYALVGLTFMVVMVLVNALAGIVVALVAGAQAVEVAGAVVSSALSAAMALYFVAIFAAVHRQLAGPSPQGDSAAFD